MLFSFHIFMFFLYIFLFVLFFVFFFLLFFYVFFFFVKQKTEYVMLISDWSSDVCSSDLTCVPSTWRSAACSRCVALWLRMVAPRRGPSTEATRWSPTFSVPAASLPTWPWNWPAYFWVSATAKRTPCSSSSPVSPTWPPDSA